MGYLAGSLSSLAERIRNFHRLRSLLKQSALYWVARNGIVFRLCVCVCMCVSLSFPHQSLWWKLFTLLSGMQASAQRWLAKLLFYKRSTKNYQGIKGDKKGFIEFGVQSSPNHASWVFLFHRNSPREIWAESSSVYMAFIVTTIILGCVLCSEMLDNGTLLSLFYLWDLYH